MKNLKNIVSILSLSLIMLLSFNANAQKVGPSDGIEVVPSSSITGQSLEIPKALKVDVNSKNENRLITARKFDKKLGGYVYVTGYVDSNGNAQIASAHVPAGSSAARNSGCPNGYRACARACTQSPTDSGHLMCTIYCMIDCSGNTTIGQQ